MAILREILIVLFILSNILVAAQENKEKIPSKAAIYSTIIPGAGQFYTKKYWKVPFIYTGLITSAYYIKESHNLHILYKNTYLKRMNGEYNDEFSDIYSNTDLKKLTDHYRRNREISVLLFSLTYIINILDASVNAHLFNYDISDNLSMHIEPFHIRKENITGLSLCFNL